MNSLKLFVGTVRQAQGQALSGFQHAAHVELDASAYRTLRVNRPHRHLVLGNLSCFNVSRYVGIDLVAGGVPRPPLSNAGKWIGDANEQNVSPDGIRFVKEIRLRSVMIENVREILDAALEIRYGVAINCHA